MNYTQKYYDEIFEKMLNDSLERGLISHAEEFPSYIANQEDISNYYVMDKSVIADMFSTVYEDITNVYNRIDINIAEGKDLDNIGDILGIPRPSATYAMVELTFMSNSNIEEDIHLDEGFIVSTKTGIQYMCLEEVYIPVGVSEVNVQAICLIPGVRGKVGEGALTILETNATGLSVTNLCGSSGGVEEYSDDEYRELLLNWRLIYLKGSLEAYEYYFSNFDGLDGFKLVPNWDGSGTLKVILDPGTEYQLNYAYNEIKNNISQVDVDVTLFSPVQKYIDIYAVVNVDIDQVNPFSNVEKENISSRIESATKVFINGGYRENGDYYPGLSIGEDFIPHKLAVFLDDEVLELKDINFNYPSSYVSISDEEIGVANNIVIEVK